MAKFYYCGHGSLRFKTNENKVIYIDPYAGKGYDLMADYVFITHEHYDHNNLSLIKQNDRTIVIRSTEWINKDGTHKTYIDDFVKVRATPAGNKNHNPKDCVGFIIEFDGLKIYCAGDTSFMPFMENLSKENLDYAFLPCDGIYNMNVIEASKVANLIKAKHLIPIHTSPTTLLDLNIANKLNAIGKIIVKPNEEITL